MAQDDAVRAGDAVIARLIAQAMHDARCGPEKAHRTQKAYSSCIDFYADHADLALSALWDAGYEVVHRG